MIICFLWNANLFFVIPWETLVDCLHFSGLFAGWQSRQVNVSLQCNFKNLQQTQPIEASRTHGGQKRRESESLVLTNLKRSREGHRTTQNLTSIDRDKNIMMVSFWLRITALLRTEHLDGDEQCPLQLSDLLEKVTEAERAAAAFRSWTSSLSGFPFRSILARIETPSGESHTIYTHRYGRELWTKQRERGAFICKMFLKSQHFLCRFYSSGRRHSSQMFW